MCTQANYDAIGYIINDFVAEEKNFTAFDVTQEGFNRGTTTETHRHLKGAVHARWYELQSQGYTRVLIPTPTGDTWLYHPVGADIQPDIDRINPNGVNINVDNADDDNDDDDDDYLLSPNIPCPGAQTNAQTGSTKTFVRHVTDVEGRLHLSKSELSQIGAKPGDKIVIYLRPNKIEIRIDNRQTMSSHNTYFQSVNHDGRVRIGKLILNHLNSPAGSFKIVVHNDCLVIEPFLITQHVTTL